MKKTAISLAVILTLTGFVSLVVLRIPSSSAQQFKNLSLEVRATNDTYLPGEPVNLHFKVSNSTEEEIPLSPGSNVETGYLQVFVALGDGEYRQYLGPRWGLKDSFYVTPLMLKQNEVFETEASILWNQQIPTSHLNENAARRITKGQITSIYALSDAGIYRIKAVLINPETTERIESQPVQVTVTEPAGDDLKVWNLIRHDARHAYFLQTGELNEPSASDKEQDFIGKVEQLIAAYPRSRYAAHFNRSFAKYKLRREKHNPHSNSAH